MSKFSDSTFYLAPSGYRETILFPQKPLSSIGHLSVGRASSATRTNPAGQIEEVCYNLFRYSEDFSNAVWNKSLGTFTTNTTVAPDGNLTADTFTKTSAVNTVSTVDSTLTTYSNTGIYTLSVYIKPIVGNSILLRLDSSGNTANASFNFTTKTLLNAGANIISSSYQELPNGWFRLSITGNVLNTSWTSSICNLFSNPTNDAMAIWGAQLVQGNLPKDYLYTSDRLNFPRVDYSDGSASFLLEPQRTNLVTYSEQFDNVAWVKTNSTVSANTTTSPDGTTNADSLVDNSTSGIHGLIAQNIGGSGTYTFSFYAKANTLSRVGILTNSTVNLSLALTALVFDLENGVVVNSVSGITASIQSVGNGWYRCSAVIPSSGAGNYLIATSNGGTTVNYIGSGQSVFVYGAQLELGAYLTTYIPTQATTATRLADTFTRNNIFTNNLISSSGGTWFVEFKNNIAYTRDTFADGLQLTNASITDRFTFTFGAGSPASGLVTIRKAVGGTLTSLYQTLTSSLKVAIKWNGSTADIFANGVKVVSGTVFTATTQLENLTASGADAPKYITQMALWNTPLSDSQCIELTGVAYTTPAQAYGSLNLVSESPDCLYTSVNTINRI
jgi:hypothetical protein